MLTGAGIGNRQNLARGLGANKPHRWVLHGETRTDVSVDPLHMTFGLNASALGDEVEHVVRPVLNSRVGHACAGLDDDFDDR